MELNLLDGELILKICFDKTDREFDDNICLSFYEPCYDDARLFRAEETNIFITPAEARELAEILIKAADSSDLASHDSV